MGTFLPRIQSVFYAGFDVTAGPKIICQVPEGLITVPQPVPSSTFPSLPPTPSSESAPSPSLPPLPASRNSNLSLPAVVPLTDIRPNYRNFSSPQGKISNNQAPLFNFEEVSKLVIPGPALCGRLVICSTKRHRVMGFPSLLRGEKYPRNFFRFNLCFVFERTADLSCYEPIVRKISRVLASCEEESGFLSVSDHVAIHAILEQLYEDLNSYSETSIPIDQFNSIELKIFPFYPNPPAVKDWMVPVALINLVRRIEDNWDLTMAKVCRYIDGVNHVSRIAHLADCDIKLTREAISHLLYYQVIMTIDIFQYSNMYTLRKSIQWLADEAHVKEECGPYSTKPGFPLPDWPKLLHLYSRMKPGRTVLEWMEEYNVQELGVDVRRFTSFGVIKGFLRRVHRYPIFLPGPSKTITQSPTSDDNTISTTNLKRVRSFTGMSLELPIQSPESPPLGQHLLRGRATHTAIPAISLSSDQATSAPATPRGRINPTTSNADANEPYSRPRRPSAAERILESVRNRDQNLTRSPASSRTSRINYSSEPSSVSTVVPGIVDTANTPKEKSNTPMQNPRMELGLAASRRQSLIPPMPATNVPPNSPNIPRLALNPPPRPRIERSPSAPTTRVYNGIAAKSVLAPVPLEYPTDLMELLDGEHHADELAVKFEAGWPLLEDWLRRIGEGHNGRVLIIYR
ncbi:nitrogen permease regulator 2-domain-containing protein [Lentinula aciculospora]|uniref:Nitrogen permease regulator 2-domain-containing protein n=1 Tax=Lentinula aciculospora TaxID=153920 RepID=A0A9W9ARX3_9AGAR|nr:nitrogen permease regulator 2-domain-containing protein [Lentinula aciculospora]